MRNAQSGDEREIVTAKGFAFPIGPSVSPDGKQLAYLSSNGAYIVSIDGGGSREVFRPTPPARLGNVLQWTPDGRRLIIGTSDLGANNNDKKTIWAISVDGGSAVRLDPTLDIPLRPSLSIHPDGHQVAFDTGEVKREIWALENFLPAAVVKR